MDRYRDFSDWGDNPSRDRIVPNLFNHVDDYGGVPGLQRMQAANLGSFMRNYLLEGCEMTSDTIGNGWVLINGKIIKFISQSSGASNGDYVFIKDDGTVYTTDTFSTYGNDIEYLALYYKSDGSYERIATGISESAINRPIFNEIQKHYLFRDSKITFKDLEADTDNIIIDNDGLTVGEMVMDEDVNTLTFESTTVLQDGSLKLGEDGGSQDIDISKQSTYLRIRARYHSTFNHGVRVQIGDDDYTRTWLNSSNIEFTGFSGGSTALGTFDWGTSTPTEYWDYGAISELWCSKIRASGSAINIKGIIEWDKGSNIHEKANGNLYIVGQNNIIFFDPESTGTQIKIDPDQRHFYPNSNNKGSLGHESYWWNSLYTVTANVSVIRTSTDYIDGALMLSLSHASLDAGEIFFETIAGDIATMRPNQDEKFDIGTRDYRCRDIHTRDIIVDKIRQKVGGAITFIHPITMSPGKVIGTDRINVNLIYDRDGTNVEFGDKVEFAQKILSKNNQYVDIGENDASRFGKIYIKGIDTTDDIYIKTGTDDSGEKYIYRWWSDGNDYGIKGFISFGGYSDPRIIIAGGGANTDNYNSYIWVDDNDGVALGAGSTEIVLTDDQLDMGAAKIANLENPELASDAATKSYVDGSKKTIVDLTGVFHSLAPHVTGWDSGKFKDTDAAQFEDEGDVEDSNLPLIISTGTDVAQHIVKRPLGATKVRLHVHVYTVSIISSFYAAVNVDGVYLTGIWTRATGPQVSSWEDVSSTWVTVALKNEISGGGISVSNVTLEWGYD